MQRVKKRGCVSYEQRLAAVLALPVGIFQSGKLKCRSDPVWTAASKSLNFELKPSTIFFDFSQNRQEICTKYKREKGLEVDIESEETEIEVFQIILSRDEWMDVKPRVKKSESGHPKVVLGDEYCNIVTSKIYEVRKIPCCVNIVRGEVRKNHISLMKPWIEIQGRCKDCSAQVRIFKELENECDDQGSTMTVEIYKRKSDVAHNYKRKLTKQARGQIKEKLLNKPALQVRRELINQDMNIGDQMPPHISSVQVLRKARQEKIDEVLGIDRTLSFVESLSRLKTTVAPELRKYIVDVGLDKAYIFYWSEQQTWLYNKIEKEFDNPISIDATGGVVQRINRPNDGNSAVFLYTVVSHINDLIIPVAQMVSEKHDANFIGYWLQEWIRKGAKIPKSVIVDRSKALENATAKAFNNVTFSMYNNFCIMLLLGEIRNLSFLKCWIRNDIAHILKSLTMWKCFKKNENKRLKYFFMLCLGYLTTVENFDEFSETVKSILKLALTPLDTVETRESRIKLANRIQDFAVKDAVMKDLEISSAPTNPDIHHHLAEDNRADEEQNQENDQASDQDQTDRMQRFIRSLQPEVSQDVANDPQNFMLLSNEYYSQEFAKMFNAFLRVFPTWSCVMRQHFRSPIKVATSARSERHFLDIKQTMKTISANPLRMDTFVSVHCTKIIEPLMKEGYDVCAKIQFGNQTRGKILNESLGYLNAQENWKNQVELDNKKDYSISSSRQEQSLSLNISLEHDYCKPSNQSLSYTEFNEENVSVSTETDISTSVPDRITIPDSRGKYVSAQPDIHVVLQKPIGSKPCSSKILENASCHPPIKTHRKTVALINSCAFDAISEIIVHAYRNIATFRKLVDDLSNDRAKTNYFQFIVLYAKEGACSRVYSKRGDILHHFFRTPNTHTVDCKIDVTKLFINLFENPFKPVQIWKCVECFSTKILNFQILTLPSKRIWQGELINLEEIISQTFKKSKQLCEMCDKYSREVTCKLGGYLCIDVWGTFAEIGGRNYRCSLDEIPTRLTLDNKHYQLCGAVEFQPDIKHYVAYCKSIDGRWDRRDDLERNAKKLNLTRTQQKEKLKFGCIFYAQCE